MNMMKTSLIAMATLVAATCVSLQLHAADSGSNYSTTSYGRSNDYRPSFAVNAEPVWLVLGGMGLKFEYFVTDKVSAGVTGMFIPSHRTESTSVKDENDSAYKYNYEHSEVLVGSNIMLMGTLGTRGLYINPAIGYQRTRISDFSDSKLSGELSTPMARFTVGYQWILAKHLRLAAGGGLAAYQSSTITVKDKAGNEVLSQSSSSMGGLAIDLQVGYVM
jgi:hypothetical protein